MKIRRSPQTMIVLADFLEDPLPWKYGYDISQNTGLKSGTLYPILMRLAEHGILQTRWAVTETGRPPRHLYKLTKNGLRYSQEQLIAAEGALRRPAFREVRA
jgi:PadR family transcriptional regulator PadR